jgi:hypothetical protein
MACTGAYSRAVILPLLILASLSAWGQQTMPGWLAPFPQARDQSAVAAAAEVTSSYSAPAQAADVIAHYEQQMRAAGITFKTQSDGIGVSIVASADRASAVVRIREDDGVSTVNVSYAVTPDKTAGLVLAASRPQTAGPARAVPVSLPASPYAHVPYTWILQSVIVSGSKPPRYNAFFYEAPTDATALQPLNLPAAATIVDVAPKDCVFTVQDQAGHSFTFNKEGEAKGRILNPGAWSVYPVKCSGIDVYLR